MSLQSKQNYDREMEVWDWHLVNIDRQSKEKRFSSRKKWFFIPEKQTISFKKKMFYIIPEEIIVFFKNKGYFNFWPEKQNLLFTVAT